MTMRYVVAALHPWNRRAFEEARPSLPGEWTFLDDANFLTHDRLQALHPRYVFFLHWSERVPQAITDAFECVGFHMTDLPYGRGGSPLQNLIERGHKVTKLTAFRLGPAWDSGPVYLKEDLPLDGTAQEIYERAAGLAMRMVRTIVQSEPRPVAQEGEAVVFRRRTPDQSEIQAPATLERLYDHIRMLSAEGYPPAFLRHGGFRFEFTQPSYQDGVLEARVRIIKEGGDGL